MSQSATSSSLADLERQFDVQLFDRMGKRLRLSERGGGCAPAPRRSWSSPASSSAASRAGEVEHRVRVGATLTIGNYVAVPLVARFMRAHPGARADPRRRQHRGDRAPGRELRARRRPGRGRGRPPRSRDHALARRPARRVLRARASARTQARAHRRRPAGRELDRARARLRHAAGLRPRDARPPAAAQVALTLGRRRRSSGRSKPGSGSAACHASRSRTRSSAARSSPVASRTATSAASSTSSFTRGSSAAPASTAGSPSAAKLTRGSRPPHRDNPVAVERSWAAAFRPVFRALRRGMSVAVSREMPHTGRVRMGWPAVALGIVAIGAVAACSSSSTPNGQSHGRRRDDRHRRNDRRRGTTGGTADGRGGSTADGGGRRAASADRGGSVGGTRTERAAPAGRSRVPGRRGQLSAARRPMRSEPRV